MDRFWEARTRNFLDCAEAFMYRLVKREQERNEKLDKQNQLLEELIKTLKEKNNESI